MSTIHDPLADAIIRAPAGAASDELSGRSESDRLHLERERQRNDLKVAARKFGRHDDIAASVFGAMRRSEMLIAAGVGAVPNASLFDDSDLRAVLYYVDRKRAENGGQRLAPEPIDTTVKPTPPPAPVALPGIPRSKGNKWRVAKGGKVAMPGGIYNVATDTIVDYAQGRAYLENLVAHGLVLEPYPAVPPSITCPDCDTVRPIADLDTGKAYPEGCPMCLMLRDKPAERIADLEASEASLRDSLATTEARAAAAEARAAALTAWAVREGAPKPDADGTWQGEPHPAPLKKKGKASSEATTSSTPDAAEDKATEDKATK